MMQLDVEWTHTFIQTTLHQIMIVGEVHKSAENQMSWGVDIGREVRFLLYEQTGSLCEAFLSNDEVVFYSKINR